MEIAECDAVLLQGLKLPAMSPSRQVAIQRYSWSTCVGRSLGYCHTPPFSPHPIIVDALSLHMDMRAQIYSLLGFSGNTFDACTCTPPPCSGGRVVCGRGRGHGHCQSTEFRAVISRAIGNSASMGTKEGGARVLGVRTQLC